MKNHQLQNQKQFCETRWSEQYEPVKGIMDNISVIVDCLEYTIGKNRNSFISGQALDLLKLSQFANHLL